MATEAQLDLPLITEATNEYYRNIYADPDLGPIFRGINMVVLRNHVSYFIHQVTMFDTPMSNRQLEYLRKVHAPVIAQHSVTTHHYSLMLNYLFDAMRTNGAEEAHLSKVRAKLLPLRDLFPPANGSEDARVLVQQDGGVEPKLHPQAVAVASTTVPSNSSSSHSANTHNTHKRSDSSGKGEREQRPAWLRRITEAFCVCGGKQQEQHQVAAAAVGTAPGRCPFQA